MMRIVLAGFLAAFLLVNGQSAEPTGAPAVEETNGNAARQTVTVTPESLFANMLMRAENGSPPAMLNVGLLYEQGVGVPRNFTKALEWYQKAALAGEKEGWMRAGACYEIGMGTAADLDKAVSHYNQAAQMGLPQAQYKLASLYFMGRGVARDESKGFELLQKAAAGGDGAAANELALAYLKGLLGQKEDPVKAREWFLKSAKSGHLEGMKNYAVTLKDGIGQKAEPAASLCWYLIAAKGGLRAPDMESTMDGLKKLLSAAQVKAAEEAADKWIADFAARRRQSNNRQAGN